MGNRHGLGAGSKRGAAPSPGMVRRMKRARGEFFTQRIWGVSDKESGTRNPTQGDDS